MILNFALARKMLRRNIGANIFFFLSIFVTSALVLIICNTLNNTILEKVTLESTTNLAVEIWKGLNVPDGAVNSSLSTFSLLLFVAMLYSLVLNYYTNQVFAEEYRKPITTLMLVGYSSYDAAIVLFDMYLIIGVPAIILSVLSSKFILIPRLDKYVYALYNVVDAPIGEIYDGTYVIYASMIMCSIGLFITARACDLRFFSVNELLHKRVRANKKYKSLFFKTISTLLFVCLYVTSILEYSYRFLDLGIYTSLVLGCGSIYGLLNCSIPNICSAIKAISPSQTRYLVLSELVADLKKTFLSIILLMVSVIVSIVLICEIKTSPMVCIISEITLGAIVVMLSISIFSQLYLRINERLSCAYQQYLIGINKKAVLVNNTLELFIFFLVIILLSSVFCLGTIIPAIKTGFLIAKYGSLYLALLITPLLICMIASMFVFNKKVKEKLN